MTRITKYEQWYQDFRQALSRLDTTQQESSPLPIIEHWRHPLPNSRVTKSALPSSSGAVCLSQRLADAAEGLNGCPLPAGDIAAGAACSTTAQEALMRRTCSVECALLPVSP